MLSVWAHVAATGREFNSFLCANGCNLDRKNPRAKESRAGFRGCLDRINGMNRMKRQPEPALMKSHPVNPVKTPRHKIRLPSSRETRSFTSLYANPPRARDFTGVYAVIHSIQPRMTGMAAGSPSAVWAQKTSLAAGFWFLTTGFSNCPLIHAARVGERRRIGGRFRCRGRLRGCRRSGRRSRGVRRCRRRLHDCGGRSRSRSFRGCGRRRRIGRQVH
jgi:hypothetical protein